MLSWTAPVSEDLAQRTRALLEQHGMADAAIVVVPGIVGTSLGNAARSGMACAVHLALSIASEHVARGTDACERPEHEAAIADVCTVLLQDRSYLIRVRDVDAIRRARTHGRASVRVQTLCARHLEETADTDLDVGQIVSVINHNPYSLDEAPPNNVIAFRR